jgi:hypothetical protein
MFLAVGQLFAAFRRARESNASNWPLRGRVYLLFTPGVDMLTFIASVGQVAEFVS